MLMHTIPKMPEKIVQSILFEIAQTNLSQVNVAGTSYRTWSSWFVLLVII